MANVIHLAKRLVVPPIPARVQGIAIRDYAGAADMETWLSIRERAFASEIPAIRPWDERDFRAAFLDRPWWRPERLWFAESASGEAVGTIGQAERGRGGSALAVIHWLAVVPEWRGRGIGRLLVSTLEGACWERGVREVGLESHAGWEPAVALYRAMGYRK